MLKWSNITHGLAPSVKNIFQPLKLLRIPQEKREWHQNCKVEGQFAIKSIFVCLPYIRQFKPRSIKKKKRTWEILSLCNESSFTENVITSSLPEVFQRTLQRRFWDLFHLRCNILRRMDPSNMEGLISFSFLWNKTSSLQRTWDNWLCLRDVIKKECFCNNLFITVDACSIVQQLWSMKRKFIGNPIKAELFAERVHGLFWRMFNLP